MQGSNILIVEDERILANDISQLLERFGYIVQGSLSNGQDAIQSVDDAETKPDLILMDVRLHGDMDGIEAANRIKEKHDIPIIYLTAYADDDTIQRAKITEPFGYILKPFDDRELHTVIEMGLYKHRMQQTLKASEAQYRTLFEQATDAILVLDSNGKLLEVNPSGCKMVGYSHEELVGLSIKTLIPEEDWQQDPIKFNDLIGGKAVYRERRFLCKDNRIITIEVSAKMLQDGNIHAFGRDITRRKQAEKELQKMHKLKSVGILAGGIAHDFNNIMMGLYGNISLAKSNLSKDHPGYKSLEDAENSMTRATRLTKQLLTFSKGGTPVIKKVRIDGLVKEVTRFDLSGSNVKSVFTQAAELWIAAVDEGQIQQVFSNLIINASQAMPEGGHLYITLENADFSYDAPSSLNPGKYIKVTVKDEGTGINQKHLDKIFDPYFTTKQTGSGLGLATAYSIIIKHKGKLSVTSELGIGTTFTLYLPASVSQKLSVAEQPKVDVHYEKQTAKILVMDDEDAIREVTARMLKRSGYSVATVSDGKQAIEQYVKSLDASEPFDAIIMDITIPGGMGGKDAIKEILEIDPQARAIVSSGYANDPIMADFADFGFKATAEKPYTMDHLRDVLGQVLKK